MRPSKPLSASPRASDPTSADLHIAYCSPGLTDYPRRPTTEYDRSSVGEDEHFAARHVWEAVTDWQVWLLSVVNMSVIMPGAH